MVLSKHLIHNALGCTELIATQHDGHAAGNVGQEQCLLACRIAASDNKDLLATEEHAVTRRAIRNATTAIRVLANKTRRTRRGAHARNDALGRCVAHIMMDGILSRIGIVIDACHHTPFNLGPQAFSMLLEPLTKFGAAQQWNTRIILNLVGCSNLSARHTLLKDSRRKVGARRINGGSIARGAAADNRNIDCLIGNHEESSRRNVVVLCAHTQIYVNVTLMHYNDKSRNKAEGELSMDQTQTSNSAPLPMQATPQPEQMTVSPAQKPLVTIVHASVGSGHKAAANAIAQAFDLIRGTKGIPKDIEIEVLDILDFGRIRFDGNKTAASFTGATRPIYDLTWRYTLTGHLLWGGGTAWSRIMFPAFNEYVRTRRPIAVVATHITAANVAVGARVITGIDYPVICVPTDYEVEGFWPHKDTDLFCVANEFMAETLRPRKVPESKIRITGIPIRAGFDSDYKREDELSKFNLPIDKTVVLVMAGASLPQPYVRFRAAMDHTLPFLRSFEDMHFVFLPGKDKEYAKRLKTLFDAMKLDNVTVLDYVDDMAALMHGCDLAILKSGGLTVTECLCAHLPMILLGKSYGQEKANTTMLTGMGASMHVTTARELIVTLRHLHDHPESLKALLINGEVLRRPHAAKDIAIATMELVGKPQKRKRAFCRFYWGGKPAHIP